MCSTQGLGVTALGGGDYDGDDVAVTTDEALIAFLQDTQAHVQSLREKYPVTVQVPNTPAKAWTDQCRDVSYVEHATTVPTPQVRGVATALAEKAQARHRAELLSQNPKFPQQLSQKKIHGQNKKIVEILLLRASR